MCAIDWAALGTWAAVVLALALALYDSFRRRADERRLRETTSQLLASDLIVQMLDGFQSLIELAHHYVRLRFDKNKIPAESDFIECYQRNVLTLKSIPGDGLTRSDLLGVEPNLAKAIVKLRSDSRLLNGNLNAMAQGNLPVGIDRQTLIAQVAPTILPGIYQVGRLYLQLGESLKPFSSAEAIEYVIGFNASVADDVIKYVTPEDQQGNKGDGGN